MSQVPDSIDGIMKEVPKSVDEVVRLPIYFLLIVLSGALAILLGIVFGIVEIALGSIGMNWIGGAIVHVVVCVIMGPFMIFAYLYCKRDKFLGSLLAGLFSIVLIGLGGIAGLISGLLGLFGALITFFKSLDEPRPGFTPPPPAPAPTQPMVQVTVHPSHPVTAVPVPPADTALDATPTSPPKTGPVPVVAPEPAKPTSPAPPPPPLPDKEPTVKVPDSTDSIQKSAPLTPTQTSPPSSKPSPAPSPQPSPTPPSIPLSTPPSPESEKKDDIAAPADKFCTQCGALIPASSVFCPSCGAKQG